MQKKRVLFRSFPNSNVPALLSGVPGHFDGQRRGAGRAQRGRRGPAAPGRPGGPRSFGRFRPRDLPAGLELPVLQDGGTFRLIFGRQPPSAGRPLPQSAICGSCSPGRSGRRTGRAGPRGPREADRRPAALHSGPAESALHVHVFQSVEKFQQKVRFQGRLHDSLV